MIRLLLPLAALALAACGERSGTDGSEDDFAARVGAGDATSSAVETAAPVVSKAVKGPPPANANVFELEKLGDISGVNLGPRAGGCTFSSVGTEMLIAAAPSDRSIPGKGVVRIGGKLIELDTPPGGIEAIKAGTTFRGEGFSVRVQPTGPGKAAMTITDAEGQTKTVPGDYVCA
jgi:hypothetical protein